MRKKLSATMLLMVMAVLLLVGCGKEKAAEDDKSRVEVQQTTTSQEEEEEKEKITITFERVDKDDDDDEDSKVSEVTADTYRYYYNQLTAEEKIMYEAILSAKDELIENRTVTVLSLDSNDDRDYSFIGDEVSNAYSACLMDNPEISIWINAFACSMEPEIILDEDGKHSDISYNIVISPIKGETTYADFESPEETRQAVQLVEERSKSFVETLSGLSDEEKATQIHNWILEDAKYDKSVSVPNLRSVYGAIVQKECVCAGFAYAFKYVSNMAGLDTIIVTGTGITPTAPEGGPHAWNNICLDGNWSLVDLTWDCEGTALYEEKEDSYVKDGAYVISKSYTFVGSTYGSDYLFKPLSEAVDTHVPSEEFKVPTP